MMLYARRRHGEPGIGRVYLHYHPECRKHRNAPLPSSQILCLVHLPTPRCVVAASTRFTWAWAGASARRPATVRGSSCTQSKLVGEPSAPYVPARAFVSWRQAAYGPMWTSTAIRRYEAYTAASVRGAPRRRGCRSGCRTGEWGARARGLQIAARREVIVRRVPRPYPVPPVASCTSQSKFTSVMSWFSPFYDSLRARR